MKKLITAISFLLLASSASAEVYQCEGLGVNIRVDTLAKTINISGSYTASVQNAYVTEGFDIRAKGNASGDFKLVKISINDLEGVGFLEASGKARVSGSVNCSAQ